MKILGDEGFIASKLPPTKLSSWPHPFGKTHEVGKAVAPQTPSEEFVTVLGCEVFPPWL
jgi:hypothetical protein